MTVTVQSVERKQFQAEGSDSVGNSLDASLSGNEFSIHIENPWAGDTESGFGRTCYIDIPKEDAIALARWILATEDLKD